MALKQAKIPSDILGTPEESKQVDVAFEPERQRLAERQDARMALGEELSKSQKLQAEEESKQKIAVKEAGVRATGDYISDVEREQRQYREQISANPLPSHKPTQEDLSTYAQLGSLLMTMGLMIGAGGKGNAKAGLDAMTGMLNGWKKGRQDLWKQEAVNFEKAFNKVKADRDTIYKNLQEGMKLASTNYAAAKEKFETAAFIAGEGSIVAHRIRTGQLQQALKDMENVDKVWEEFNNKKRAAVSSLAQARLQRELAEKQRDAMIQAARIRAAAQAAKGGGGLLKPGAEVTKNYLGQNALLADMQDIAKDLKDPKMRKLINDYRLEGFASEELGKIVAQIANDELPSELRKFLVKVRNVRNNYYLTISGKAVTGGEALRNYGVVSQPGDSAEAMSDKTESMIKQVERTIGQYQRLYGLPSVDAEMIGSLRTPTENSTFDVRSMPVEDAESTGMADAAKAAFGEYDPKKYDYRRNPETGRLQRKEKE